MRGYAEVASLPQKALQDSQSAQIHRRHPRAMRAAHSWPDIRNYGRQPNAPVGLSGPAKDEKRFLKVTPNKVEFSLFSRTTWVPLRQ